MLKLCLSILLVMGFLSAAALAVPTDDFRFKKTFQSAQGVVAFDHEAHALGRVKDCATCHSALKTFGGQVNELFAHNFCQNCHASKNGPTECNGCHRNSNGQKKSSP